MSVSIKDIVENDLCVGCGICVSESVSSKMIWNEYGFLVPELDGLFNDLAIKVCPFNSEPDSDVSDEDKLAAIYLSDSSFKDERIGRYEKTYVGYSNNYRASSSSGGIATYIFEQLLQQGYVDHLFIVKEINGNYSYQWFNNVNQIREISKTRYIPVSLDRLFVEIDSKKGKVAVSGVACFIKAIRLKQYVRPEYKEKIPFLVGIICGGLKSSFFTDYLVQKSGIHGAFSKQEYRIKDPNSTASDYSFGAYSNENTFHEMKMRSVGDMWGTGLFKANACDYCDDVTTELADISLGDAWLSPYSSEGMGTSVIVTRTKFADKLIQSGISSKLLEVHNLSLELFKKSQAGSFKHRQSAELFRLRKRKKHDKLLPFKREKFFVSIPSEFQFVQSQRMKLRMKSLEIWKQNPLVEEFESAIGSYKLNLKIRTRLYHFAQNLRSRFGLKKL